MQIEKITKTILPAVAIGLLISGTSFANTSTVFEDNFANGVVTDSKDTAGYWTVSLGAGAGDANAVSETGGTLTMTAGSNDGENDGSHSGVNLSSAISSSFNFFTKPITFSVRGITFDDFGTGLTAAQQQFRFCLLSGANESWSADDAVVVKVAPDGTIRLGAKENEPSNNSDGAFVDNITGLGADGTYGFDLIVGPVGSTTQVGYQLVAYTNAVPVVAGSTNGLLSLAKANWGASGSGDAKLCFWTQEGNVTGGNEYFQATITNVLVQSDDNLLFNPGLETGTTAGWDDFGGTLSTETATVYDGTYAGRLSSRANVWDSFSRSVVGVMSTGETYRVSIWARLGSGSDQPARFRLRITDGTPATTRYLEIDTKTLTSTNWTLLQGNVTYAYTPPLDSALLYIRDISAGVDLLVDEASVTKFIQKKGTVLVIR